MQTRSALQRPSMTESKGQTYITLEQVREACIALLTQGRRVGPVNVRLQLGNRGSYATITRHLRTLGFAAPSPRGSKKEGVTQADGSRQLPR
ncbi:DNA-binding protein [Variovorax ureilyticus]|uniref:DNA-binding protein n=1 Tax=Variovorax ureilyticus TaxID=1836198 RepID=UPI003D66BCFF